MITKTSHTENHSLDLNQKDGKTEQQKSRQMGLMSPKSVKLSMEQCIQSSKMFQFLLI